MEKLVSNWFHDVGPTVPEDYIFPPETRPGDLHVPISQSIPVIDLSEAEQGDPTLTIHKILKASQDFGFFQVINHGVPENLMKETMSVFKEFFQLPPEAKQHFYSEDLSKPCRLYRSTPNYATEKLHLWREALRHPCHPLEQWNHSWPQTPTTYKECVGTCSIEIKKLGSRILRLISEGLGLQSDYFDGELSGSVILTANHYPPCPEPSLTLGVSKHSDPNLITILLQDDVYGLQVLKDDSWIGVEPNPRAFVVNISNQLQVISNDKLKSGEHRVVTNASDGRTSAAFFIGALEESIIEPAKSLTDQLHPPLYKSFKTRDFVTKFVAAGADSSVLKSLRA
ncbi:protein DOWNY MILDEW RESISTANCE 6-like [Senna tora]|uniref:Protein DOWNY MILDEW RESISTANCE 6-like n=1 Tax=Senna tora TaxID=362788 RepID=A0A834TJ39_9FABA|nr:protein DOWNY MILDEW RESISTANCE 6-like [Senna tora]